MVTRTAFKSYKLREGVLQFLKYFTKVPKAPLSSIFKTKSVNREKNSIIFLWSLTLKQSKTLILKNAEAGILKQRVQNIFGFQLTQRSSFPFNYTRKLSIWENELTNRIRFLLFKFWAVVWNVISVMQLENSYLNKRTVCLNIYEELFKLN